LPPKLGAVSEDLGEITAERSGEEQVQLTLAVHRLAA